MSCINILVLVRDWNQQTQALAILYDHCNMLIYLKGVSAIEAMAVGKPKMVVEIIFLCT